MGASLPAIARWIEASPQGVAWLGFFYGGNIAGAVVGAVVAGFYLLRLYDMAIGTYVAVAINVLAGAGALLLAALVKGTGAQEESQAEEVAPSENARGAAAGVNEVPAWPVYMTIALSGLCALGAEVVWTRQLSLMLGATVYTFSIILAVFLAGLGVGSAAGSLVAKRLNSALALGVCQCLLAAATAWAAYTISTLIPSPNFDPTLILEPWALFELDLARCAWAILPAAILWGASFPLALGALAANKPWGDTGRLVGATYAANTVGGIIGALAFSMIVIPTFGTTASERWLIVLSAAAAVVVLAPLLWQSLRWSLRQFEDRRSDDSCDAGSWHGRSLDRARRSVARAGVRTQDE